MSWRWDKGQTNFQGSNNIDSPGKCDKNWASVLSLVNMQECENQIFNSSSSVGATTLGGFWSALRFRSTIFYPYTSLSSFSLSPSLNPLLLGPAISILVFLLVMMNMVPIQLIFWQFLLYPFWLRVLPNVIFTAFIIKFIFTAFCYWVSSRAKGWYFFPATLKDSDFVSVTCNSVPVNLISCCMCTYIIFNSINVEVLQNFRWDQYQKLLICSPEILCEKGTVKKQESYRSSSFILLYTAPGS